MFVRIWTVFARIWTIFAHLIIGCTIRYPKIDNLRYTSCYGLCRGVFTVGVAVTEVMYRASGTISSHALISANTLADYSYIISRDGDPNGAVLACCLTGLGPNGTSNDPNGILGGLYFNGSMIPNSGEQGPCSSNVIQVRPGGSIAGVTNFHQCGAFSTNVEGIYTCIMMNSSMMNESVRFGIYFSKRSELHDL